MANFRRAMRLEGARWCPVWMLPGLGILYGMRGAPRCPMAVARAVAASLRDAGYLDAAGEEAPD